MTRRATRRTLATLAIVLLAQGSDAGEPSSDPSPATWRVLETEHYRLHFQAEADAWTRRVAARLEEARPRLEAEIGHSLEAKTVVVVADPLARANGIAWPILGRPRMVLYTTPPPADSSLAHYRDWGRLLAVHEDAHLVHLTRRSRAPLWRRLERLVPVGPIPRAAPPWVVEGYATLLEGRLTGWGRPSSDLRAAVLRAWARAGALPTYAELSGDRRRWLGLSAPYLVGSAFLEWLNARELGGREPEGRDPEAQPLRDLWARLSARQRRGFDEAFAGVFGDSPRRLYGRFVAETTFRAMQVEEARAPLVDESELWLDLAWRSSAPALSSDGERLAMVLRSPDRPSRLVVWSTAVDAEAATRREDARRRLLARDPEDVPAVDGPPPRRILAELPARHGAEPYHPRWTADGSIVFTRFEPDDGGTLRADLFAWTPGERSARRITRQGDVRELAPADGARGRAVAVRHRAGRSSLVWVDLEQGEISPVDGPAGVPSVERVVGDPALSADGRRLAYVVRDADGWSLRAVSIDRPEAPVRAPLPPAASVAAPAWSADGRRLFAGVGLGGIYEVVAFDAIDDAGAGFGLSSPRPVVRALGGALAPAPTPDGAGLFFLALESDGFDLRRIALSAETFASPSPKLSPLLGGQADLEPVIVPRRLPEVQSPKVQIPERVEDGVGPLELLPLVGGGRGASGSRLELGLRAGDVVGRFDGLVLGSLGDVEGGALAGAWDLRPEPGRIALGAHAFALDESPEGSGAPQRSRERGLELSVSGGSLGRPMAARWAVRAGASRLRLWNEVRRKEAIRDEAVLDQAVWEQTTDRVALELAGDLRGRWRWGAWTLDALGAGRAAIGTSDDAGADETWRRARGRIRVTLGHRPQFDTGWRLGTELEAGEIVDAPPSESFRVGGRVGSLRPLALSGGWVEVPALPAGVLTGSRVERARVDLGRHRSPVRLFAERIRVNEPGSASESVELWGVDLRLRRGPVPLLRLPAFDLTLGVAQVHEAPTTTLEGEIEWWLDLRWRP